MIDAVPGAYAHALRREILRSEQKRMRVVAADLVFMLCVTSAGLLLVPELARRLFREDVAPWLPLAAIGPFILFELAALAVLRYRLATDRDFPQPTRFANALVETSMPGVIIYLLALHMEPQLVFGFWPPLLYFVFIVLSTLRLDFWLSL